jgi:hypothetical protein
MLGSECQGGDKSFPFRGYMVLPTARGYSIPTSGVPIKDLSGHPYIDYSLSSFVYL